MDNKDAGKFACCNCGWYSGPVFKNTLDIISASHCYSHTVGIS